MEEEGFATPTKKTRPRTLSELDKQSCEKRREHGTREEEVDYTSDYNTSDRAEPTPAKPRKPRKPKTSTDVR